MDVELAERLLDAPHTDGVRIEREWLVGREEEHICIGELPLDARPIVPEADVLDRLNQRELHAEQRAVYAVAAGIGLLEPARTRP